MSTTWPEEVTLPDAIGIRRYRYKNGSPCCAKGHAARAFGALAKIPREWEESFVLCAELIRPVYVLRDHCMESFNDDVLSPYERVLCYAAAWALCGYEIHGFPEAVELAEKVRKRER